MVQVSEIRRALLAALFLLAAGCLTLHLHYHSPFGAAASEGLSFANYTASAFSLLDVVLVTFLFSRKKTAVWGYLINGLFVIYGVVLMTHFGWARVHSPGNPLYRYLFTPTSPYVILAAVDFLMGHVLYKLWFLEPARPKEPAAEAAG